jgi:glycosyltransferase involved in cell wall biosynthesis
MDNPSYGICMLRYNEREKVESSLASAVKFTESVLREMVVVDNENTKGSSDVLQGLGDERLKAIRRRCTMRTERELVVLTG